jgi:hypothetical protein
MRWHAVRDPNLGDYAFSNDLVVDILFDKAPEVRTLNTLDVHNFDFDSRNYNLEFTVMLTLSIICMIICLSFIVYKRKDIFKVPEDMKNELRMLEAQDDPEM